jgi:aromatic ring-opening dioxygenase catalytic subunit (LigB family)
MLRLPSLFIPHGGGPSFFMTGERKQQYQQTEDFLKNINNFLPSRPSAILIITAHWETAIPSLTGGKNPQLIYDYFGFPEHTYQLKYDAPGAPQLAKQASELLKKNGINSFVDSDYGWDHGVFIPLKVMFPDETIPVVAMSLQANLDPMQHCAIGQSLQSLRDENVLIIGSGMSYHNLRRFDEFAPESLLFHNWLDSALNGTWSERSLQLANWQLAPGGRNSHPREEHLLPLMVASGAGSDLPGKAIWRGEVGRSCIGAWAFD